MFFDRLGNAVTGEEQPIIEEPVVESYYDPNRPVRPGFEKPEIFQEGIISFIKRDMVRQTIENYFHMPSIYWNILCWDESNKNGNKNMLSVANYNGIKIDDKYSIKKMYNMHELKDSCEKIGKGKEMYPIGTLNPSGYICLGKADETLYISDDSYKKKISKFNSFITNIKIDEELSNFNPGSLEAVEKEFGVEFDDSFKSVFNKLIKTKPEAFITSGNCYFIEYESKYQSDFDKKHGYPTIQQFGYKFLDPQILLDWGDDYCDEDGCVCFAYGYPDTHCEDILLWVATKSCKKYKPGTIIESWDPPSNAYSKAEEIAPNLQSLVKKSKWVSGAEVDRIIEDQDVVEYSEMDLDEMSDYIQEYVITEATSRSLKEVKQYQKQQNESNVKMNKASFHKLVRSKMRRVGDSSDARKGSIEFVINKSDCKTQSDLNNLYELISKVKLLTDKTNLSNNDVTSKLKKDIFKIINMDSTKYDIYLNNTHADIGKGVKICMFESTGMNRTFPKVGYRFFHFRDTELHDNKISPSAVNQRGHNRIYADTAVFFMAIKNQDAKKLLTTKECQYGKYVYEYIPKAHDTFYEDLANNTDHKSVVRSKNADLNEMMIPVFILTKKALPVKKVYNNLKSIEYLKDNEQNSHARYVEEKRKMYKSFKRRNDGLILNPKSQLTRIKNAKTIEDLINISAVFNNDDAFDVVEDLRDNRINFEEGKREILQLISDQIEDQSDDLQEFKDDFKYESRGLNEDNERMNREIIKKRNHVKRYPVFESYTMFDDEDYDVYLEANEASKKARKNAQEFMRNEYGSSHPTSMTSKQRNRMKKWLKDNDYDPKNGTIATDMKDSGGNTIRVNLGTNSAAGKNMGLDSNAAFNIVSNPLYPKEKYTPAEQRAFAGGRDLINMPKSYMKRHPSISTGISKHEEGHIADYHGKIDDAVDKRLEADEYITQSMKKGVDYSPTHTNVNENIADLYSVRHNKYKDKLRFLNAVLSDDIHMQKYFKTLWEKLCKNVYKKLSDDQPPIIDASSVETMRDSMKNLVSRNKANIKSYKAQLKTPIYQSGKNLLKRTIDNMTKTCNDFEKILRKWFLGKLLFKKVGYDDAKVEVDRIVWEDAKRTIDEAIRQNDGDIEIRREFLKKYINEFAVEYDMSTVDVIQEMYLQDMEDYVFQEDFEDEEPFDYDVYLEAKIDAAERNELDDEDFGLVYTDENDEEIRKYPLTDKIHIQKAVQFFGSCPDDYKPLLAHNILKKAKKFNMDTSNWDRINKANEKYSDEE